MLAAPKEGTALGSLPVLLHLVLEMPPERVDAANVPQPKTPSPREDQEVALWTGLVRRPV